MRIQLRPGRYVIAVSGGVDSMTLLDLLATESADNQMTVAHFDHGIRSDSESDRFFVQSLAEKYGLPFIYERANLGQTASEEVARKARYAFLERVRLQTGATAIITAHHQDDVLETAILNMIRGTGRKGLTSLSNRPGIMRPLLEYPKIDITAYALTHQLEWREDSTNQDLGYRRNYIRHKVMPRIDKVSRATMYAIIKQQRLLNMQIDAAIINQLHQQTSSGIINRKYFNKLPHDVSKEVLATWLREQGVRSFDAQTLERLVVGAKTVRPGKRLDVSGGRYILIDKDDLALARLER
jgi:tRNA(Ile)-lysidine synthase